MANNKRCAWCGRSDDTVESLTVDVVGPLGIKKHRVEVSVHPKHRSELDAYVTRLNNYSLLFILLNVALSFLLLIIALSTLFSKGYYVNTHIFNNYDSMGSLIYYSPFCYGANGNYNRHKKFPSIGAHWWCPFYINRYIGLRYR